MAGVEIRQGALNPVKAGPHLHQPRDVGRGWAAIGLGKPRDGKERKATGRGTERRAPDAHGAARLVGNEMPRLAAFFLEEADLAHRHAAVHSLAHVVNREQANAHGGEGFHLHARLAVAANLRAADHHR